MSEGINIKAEVRKALATVSPECAPLLRPYLVERLNGLFREGVLNDPLLPDRINAFVDAFLAPEKRVIIETIHGCTSCCHGGHLPSPCPSSICACGHLERQGFRI